MKKLFFVLMIAIALTSCSDCLSTEKVEKTEQDSIAKADSIRKDKESILNLADSIAKADSIAAAKNITTTAPSKNK